MKNIFLKDFYTYLAEDLEILITVTTINYNLIDLKTKLHKDKKEVLDSINTNNLYSYLQLDKLEALIKKKYTEYKTLMLSEYLTLKVKYNITLEEFKNIIDTFFNESKDGTTSNKGKGDLFKKSLDTIIRNINKLYMDISGTTELKYINIFENLGNLSIDIMGEIFKELRENLLALESLEKTTKIEEIIHNSADNKSDISDSLRM